MTIHATAIIPQLSRKYKSHPYLPNNNVNRKRKRSTANVCFEVRPSTNGVGMFATKNISCGDVIIRDEDPIVHSTNCKSTNGICNTCSTPIGSLRETHLMAPSDILLPYLDDDDEEEGLVFTKSHVVCQNCNEASWCSKKCHEKGHLHHSILCRGTTSSLEAFYDDVENPMIFQLATESIALILSHVAILSEKEGPMQQLHFWRDYGSHPLWWEIRSNNNQQQKRDQAEQFYQALQKTLIESMHQNKSINSEELMIHEIVTLENIGCILGMLQCNVMEYQYPSPVQQYMEHVEEILEHAVHDGEHTAEETNDESGPESDEVGGRDENEKALETGCKWLINNILKKSTNGVPDKASDTEASNSTNIQPIIGSGLYPLLTLANHDCNPNASIEFIQESNRGSMIATRDISIGEEICITYVPNGGVGGGDSSEYFHHFGPTRTWKWLNSKDAMSDLEENANGENQYSDDDDDDVNKETEDDGSSSNDDGDDVNKETEEAEAEEEESHLEGSNQKERATALLAYGFECQCKRCL